MAGVFAVFKPNTIDAGYDAEFAGTPGNTETGQLAPWYTVASEAVEHFTFPDIDEITAIINGPSGRNQILENPILRKVAGQDTYIVRMTVPVIRRTTGELVGRVGVNINTAYSQVVVNDIIHDPAIPDIVSMSLYTDNGMVIASDNPDYVGKRLSVGQSSFFGGETAAAEHAVNAGLKVRYSRYSPRFAQNMEVILYPFTIGETGVNWSILLGSLNRTIMAGVNDMRLFSILVSGVAILLISLLIYFGTCGITKPIIAITATLKDIAEGEGDLTRSIAVQSKDEIGDMARYFNATLEKTKNLVVTIKAQSVFLSQIGDDLASNMDETAAAINEIAANIRSIKVRIANQSASVTESNSVMEQIALHINRLSDHVMRQGDCVTRSSSAIEEMIANIQSVTQTLVKNGESVQDLLNASEVGRTGLEDVVEDIQRIARESEGLLEINAVIQNIASQTNLLSMNAAIEAAHAGDGQGFCRGC